MTTKTEQIRALNDQLRQNLSDGTAVMTPGVAALGAEAVARIVKTIAAFDDFCLRTEPAKQRNSVSRILGYPWWRIGSVEPRKGIGRGGPLLKERGPGRRAARASPYSVGAQT